MVHQSKQTLESRNTWPREEMNASSSNIDHRELFEDLIIRDNSKNISQQSKL